MRSLYSKHKELIIGCSFALFAGLYLAGCAMIPKRSLAMVGAEFVPYLLGYFLLFLAGCQIVTALNARRKTAASDGEAPPENGEQTGDGIGLLITFGLLCVYIALIEPLGFILASMVYLLCQMTILVPKNEPKRYGLHLVIAIVLPVIAYYVFRSGLNLVLPVGIIFG